MTGASPAGIPLPGTGRVAVAVPAPGPGHGSWVGAPSAALDPDGGFVVAYRVQVTDRRGAATIVARSADGESSTPSWSGGAVDHRQHGPSASTTLPHRGTRRGSTGFERGPSTGVERDRSRRVERGRSAGVERDPSTGVEPGRSGGVERGPVLSARGGVGGRGRGGRPAGRG
jgi:hypothetical protein